MKVTPNEDASASRRPVGQSDGAGEFQRDASSRSASSAFVRPFHLNKRRDYGRTSRLWSLAYIDR